MSRRDRRGALCPPRRPELPPADISTNCLSPTPLGWARSPSGKKGKIGRDVSEHGKWETIKCMCASRLTPFFRDELCFSEKSTCLSSFCFFRARRGSSVGEEGHRLFNTGSVFALVEVFCFKGTWACYGRVLSFVLKGKLGSRFCRSPFCFAWETKE